MKTETHLKPFSLALACKINIPAQWHAVIWDFYRAIKGCADRIPYDDMESNEWQKTMSEFLVKVAFDGRSVPTQEHFDKIRSYVALSVEVIKFPAMYATLVNTAKIMFEPFENEPKEHANCASGGFASTL